MYNKAVIELKKHMEAKEINLSRLALGIGVQSIRISEILNNKRRITADSDLRLTKFFKLPEGHFLKLQTSHDLALTKQKISSKLKSIKPYDFK